MKPLDITHVSLLVSFIALLVGFYRLTVADKNNIIAGSTPWAQLIMKYIEEEIKIVIHEESMLRSAFMTGFPKIADKTAAFKSMNNARSTSTRNLAFLTTLSPSAQPLIVARAKLSTGAYDSFLENKEMRATAEAERAFFAKYDADFKCYIEVIRDFSTSVNTERPSLFKSKRMQRVWAWLRSFWGSK